MAHEWALAQAIIESVEDYALSHGIDKVKKVIVKIGELQAIDKEVLSFALNELVKQLGEGKVDIEEFELHDEEAVLRCRACGFEWKLRDVKLSEDVAESIHFIPEVVHAFMKCPSCKSRDFEVVKGRGVYIESIEIP
ncbi:MAG: hydrogenase expression protein HupK [Candidatus Methanomethylicota archaeon]|uniref:Hydrogenase maturation factor HypA n=1 Tax=Thermoproteota archaeon TaxID=2056631 RepID=A0A497EYC2_9CREN|nr:MAG: hydrogenase expression protein HupK [Candidatus Verstraetearchaeota archaeon]